MGYLFDAMQRSKDRDERGQQPLSAGGPAPKLEDVAPVATPCPAPKLTLTGLPNDDVDPGVPPIAAAMQSQMNAPRIAAPVSPAGNVMPQIEPQLIPPSAEPRMRLAMPKGTDDRLVAALEPSSLMAEEYRAIRTGILARWQHKSHL